MSIKRKITPADNRKWELYHVIYWLGNGDQHNMVIEGRSLLECEDRTVEYLHKLGGVGLWSYRIAMEVAKGCTDTRTPL